MKPAGAGRHASHFALILGANVVGLGLLYGANKLGQGSATSGVVTCSPARLHRRGHDQRPLLLRGEHRVERLLRDDGVRRSPERAVRRQGGALPVGALLQQRRSARTGTGAARSERLKPPRATPGWLTGIALAAVAAVNLAGFWGIRVARQGALDEARRAFALDVAAKATALEGRLSEVRSDLAFLGAAPTIARLDEAGKDPEAASLLRQAAESALLLFLRSHAEVVRIGVRSSDGRPLVHVGRRGGVPVLWVSASPTGQEGAAIDPRRPRLTARLPARRGRAPAGRRGDDRDGGRGGLAPRPRARRRATPPRQCLLRDAQGSVLGRFPPGPRGPLPAGEREVRAEAPVRAEGWSAPGPLALSCAQPERTVVGLAEPVWSRYRTTYALNLAVMGLALLLGAFAVQQARRRAGLEARAAEEARVRELERQLFHAERLTTVGPPGRRHRPRDQQPARGHVELPDPRPGRPLAGRHRRGRRATSAR